MVKDINKQFYQVNKYVISFLQNYFVDDQIKTEIINAWKNKNNLNKLKNTLQNFDNKKPKKVVSMYLYFCQEERPKIFDENPGMDIKDVTCELGRRWKTFLETETNSERYNNLKKLFEQDKLRYTEAKKLIPVVKKPRQPPKSNYLKFCNAKRLENPKITMKELGLEWNLIKQNSEELIKYQV